GLAGVDFDAAAGSHDLVLTAASASGPTEKHVVSIPIERVDRPKSELSVPKRYVEPDARTRARIARERAIKAAAMGVVTPRRLFRGRFTAPVALGTSEGYGVERVFNGKRQSVHFGLGYHAPAGTRVTAVDAVHALRASAEPTLIRRTPSPARSASVKPMFPLTSTFTGFGATASTIARISSGRRGPGA